MKQNLWTSIKLSIPLALVVGSLLTLINQGPVWMETGMRLEHLIGVGMNLLIPLGVATTVRLRSQKQSESELINGNQASALRTIPTARWDSLPRVTTDQMRFVDELMVNRFHIDLVRMMENAGRHLAELAISVFIEQDPVGKRVLVLAGKGGNGGGALVAARHLSNRGAQVRVFLNVAHDQLAPVPAQQLRILDAMGVSARPYDPASPLPEGDLIIDGLIGYSLQGPPRNESAHLIAAVNAIDCPVLSLDVPSGMDATTGKTPDECINAAATLTLALPKTGLGHPSAAPHVGELYLADIGVPPELYPHLGPDFESRPLFSQAGILRIQNTNGADS